VSLLSFTLILWRFTLKYCGLTNSFKLKYFQLTSGPGKLTAPLSAFHNVLSATFCFYLAWELRYHGTSRWGVAESTLTLAESGAVNLP